MVRAGRALRFQRVVPCHTIMAEFEGRPGTSTPDRIETSIASPDAEGLASGGERESGVHLRSAPSASTLASSKPQPERKTRVLLVDDDQLVLRGLGRVLRQHGYEITTASSGRDAAQLIDEHSYDVVLSDIAMPGMDGIQLLREVRARDLSVPVVLITGSPALSSAVQALELGAFNYLTKPIAMEDVEHILDKAARMHRMALVSQQAAVLLGNTSALGADRAGLEASFERAIESPLDSVSADRPRNGPNRLWLRSSAEEQGADPGAPRRRD